MIINNGHDHVYYRLANKQDVKGAMDDIDIVQMIGLEELVNVNKCPCRIVRIPVRCLSDACIICNIFSG